MKQETKQTTYIPNGLIQHGANILLAGGFFYLTFTEPGSPLDNWKLFLAAIFLTAVEAITLPAELASARKSGIQQQRIATNRFGEEL